MASLKDVAREAGVSVATVSHTLNGTKTVSDEVRARVLAAASRVGYRPNRTARALRTGRSETLGLILPDLTNPYFPTLAQVIQQRAWALGYALLLFDSASDTAAERTGLLRLAERNVDGLIWAPIEDDPALDLPFPVVALDRSIRGVDCVSADHRRGGELLGEYAVHLGHRRIGLINGPARLTSARERRAGLISHLHGRATVAWEVEADFSFELSEAVRWRIAEPGVSLIIGGNDTLAIAALHELRVHGLTVPEDVSVLGFDDIPLAQLVDPPLTTIRQPLSDMAVAAVERLHRRIGGEDGPYRHDRLPVSLVERRSARPCNTPTSEVPAP